MPKKRMSATKRTLISTSIIIVCVFLCTIVSIAAVDVACNNEIKRWMPVYPDAELVEMNNNGFFRPRASGITNQTFYTSDDPNTVRRWYVDYRFELTSDGNPNQGATIMATTGENVVNAPDSDGSLIFYYSECAYN